MPALSRLLGRIKDLKNYTLALLGTRLINHTFETFPFTSYRQPEAPTSDWYDDRTHHRFRLEIKKPWWMATRYVTLNIMGIGNDMSGPQNHSMQYGGTYSGSEYWYFDSPNQCTPRYYYRFYARITDFTGRDRVKILSGIDGSSFQAGTLGYGEVLWYTLGQEPNNFFIDPDPVWLDHNQSSQYLYIQNLSFNSNPVEVVVEMQQGNSEYFTLISDINVLQCGDTARLAVSYLGHPGPPLDSTNAVFLIKTIDQNTSDVIGEITWEVIGVNYDPGA